MGKILPLLLILIGIGGGATAGFFLRPQPQPEPTTAESTDEDTKVESNGKKNEAEDGAEPAFVKLNNQFVVPVISEESVSALVVLSLTLETEPEHTAMLYGLEPKIRDVALRELFNHAYAGGFDGHFTAPNKLDSLRSRLVKSINTITSNTVADVLIIDIIRQDN